MFFSCSYSSSTYSTYFSPFSILLSLHLVTFVMFSLLVYSIVYMQFNLLNESIKFQTIISTATSYQLQQYLYTKYPKRKKFQRIKHYTKCHWFTGATRYQGYYSRVKAQSHSGKPSSIQARNWAHLC